jgi:hypothetical protein
VPLPAQRISLLLEFRRCGAIPFLFIVRDHLLRAAGIAADRVERDPGEDWRCSLAKPAERRVRIRHASENGAGYRLLVLPVELNGVRVVGQRPLVIADRLQPDTSEIMRIGVVRRAPD